MFRPLPLPWSFDRRFPNCLRLDPNRLRPRRPSAVQLAYLVMMQSARSLSLSLGAALLALPRLGAALRNNCSIPIVKDQELQDAITVEALYAHAEALQSIAYSTPGRNRVAGSEGHNLTGYTQQFGEISFSVNGVEYEVQGVEFSPNVTIAEAPLSIADFTDDVVDTVALIHRESCPFTQKSTLARAAGALAVIFWNNEPAAGGGISQADGEALIALSSNTTLTASLDISAVIELVASANVIVTSKYGDPNNALFVGAHSDSVSAGPGINDDGSGTIGILATAIHLSKYRTRSKFKFGWWTAEEAGLLGSTYYVSTLSEEELLKIRLYLNFDMIASLNYIFGHYDGDGSEFEYYESLGLNHTATEFNGRSDYGPFLESGVPCGGLDAGADQVKTPVWVDMFGGTAGITLDPNYHQAEDDVHNLNAVCFGIMTKGIAHAVAIYAGTAFAGYPPREAPEKRAVQQQQQRKRAAVRRPPHHAFPVPI
ncbi:hypothetical protein B0I35DRAFT_484420 [Stachybotrys elegans]|uniref:Peptide hydrolase n=1 Tax=Stachybotrys elegans TaxID=80388 RepID=A0A8K0SDL9_9HYPO|nr:hypothetical protein B0I35DRAFT_484420 [Stachybotrys elegans]